MAKKKSPRKRPPVPMTASKALSHLAEHPIGSARDSEPRESGTRESRTSGVFEELYAGELRRRAEALAVEIGPVAPAPAPAPAPSGPKLREERKAADARALEAHEARATAKQAAEDLLDDTSIPPVDVEAEQFFAEGESRASMPHLWAHEPEHLDLDEPHSDHVRRASPEVLVRRTRLRKVTQRVVAAFALIALAGLGKAAFTHAPSAELPLSSVVHAAAAIEQERLAPQALAAQPPAAVRAAAAIPPPEPAKVEEPKAEAPVAEKPTEQLAAKPSEDVKPTDEAKPAPSGDAKADKKAAQRAIDRGDNKGAVEAGERALEVDPTDAETWLIVGAAYQQMGQGAKARQAFSSCMSKSTHGPRGECAAFR